MKNSPVKCDRLDHFIDELCVDTLCRGRGYGRELMEFIAADARSCGASSVFLDYWAFNKNAGQFYQALGMTTKRTVVELAL